MNKQIAVKTREKWVDDVKVIACILVALGHLFMSMVQSGMYELKICRDYRDGKVTKEELDKCSTCDMNCVINNGLSEASKEQLKHKTGEEIVDADIAQQMETK